MDTAPHPVVLTEGQRRVVWLQSVGHTRSGIARKTGWELSKVKSLCARARRALGAATDAQAVRIGLLDGHIGPYEDCGSLAAYRRHIKRNEVTCPACRRGNRERLDAGASSRLSQMKLSAAEVRVMRALHAGRTVEQIYTQWGVSYRAVREVIDSAYATLGVSGLPRHVRREAALREAAARGFLRGPVPTPSTAPAVPAVRLTKTQVKVLEELDKGASIAETAVARGMSVGTVGSRLSEIYQRLDVAWMDKAERRPCAIRKARELGLLPGAVTA